MYLRFVVAKRGGNSASRLGIIHAIDELLGEGQLEEYEQDAVTAALWWLNKYLPVPTGVRRPGTGRAISWFKDDAEEPIQQMWVIVAALREHGVAVEVVRTSNPGRILYQDEFQVFAVPPKDRNASA
jgi:hypothetical protein